MNTDAFRVGVEQAIRQLGTSLKQSPADVAVYADGKREELARAAGQPGFDEAAQAALDDIFLFAAGRAVDVADVADARLVGILHGALAVAVAR